MKREETGKRIHLEWKGPRGKGRYVGMLCGLMAGMLLIAQPVRADVIWEPYQDSFFEEHRAEIRMERRTYTVNDPDGETPSYQSPENASRIDTIANGETVYIYYIYTDADGIEWGEYVSYDAGSKETTGWIPMAYLTVVYDTVSFEEQFADQIESEGGSLAVDKETVGVQYWHYPGARESYSLGTIGEWTPEYQLTYRDDAGHVWGKIGYYYGIRNVWICLDEPTATFEELYPNGEGAPGVSGDGVNGMVTGDDAENAAGTAPGQEGADDVANDPVERIEPKGGDIQTGARVGILAGIVFAAGVGLAWVKKRS